MSKETYTRKEIVELLSSVWDIAFSLNEDLLPLLAEADDLEEVEDALCAKSGELLSGLTSLGDKLLDL